MDGEYLDLLGLQRQVKEGLLEVFPEGVWVKAEIASVSDRNHCYLELVQSENGRQVAKARAIIWSNRYAELKSLVGEGREILALVQVNYSELYGLSLVIEDISPEFSLGDALLQRQKTIERLEKEELLDRQKELSLPVLPYRLAVISASTAAGFGDFKRHLEENEYGFRFEISLVEAAMQGESAPSEIASALREAADGGYDAILILRGGGSSLDLACYDDYSLSRAIALCPVPVFTAIGHDRDVHVADLVAYDSVKTPTALADLFVSMYASEDEMIESLSLRIRQAVAGKIMLANAALDSLEKRIALANPLAVLERGYTLVTDSGGVVLKDAEKLSRGDTITVRMKNARIKAEIKEIEYGKV